MTHAHFVVGRAIPGDDIVKSLEEHVSEGWDFKAEQYLRLLYSGYPLTLEHIREVARICEDIRQLGGETTSQLHHEIKTLGESARLVLKVIGKFKAEL